MSTCRAVAHELAAGDKHACSRYQGLEIAEGEGVERVALRRVMTGHVEHRRSVPNSEEVAAVIPKRAMCVHVLLR